MRNLGKLLILLVISFLSTSVSARAEDAVLEAVGGAQVVAVKRGGQDLKLKKGDPLLVGDELTTDRATAVDIRFPDKTIIRVGANSSYKLEEEAKSPLHRLLSGIVRVLVPPKPEKGGEVRFRMNTPEGTIGVRGTEFVVIRSTGETTLKGLEGEVLFGPENAKFENAAAFVMVKRGFESSVKKGGRPSAPREYALPAYLKAIDGKQSVFGALAARQGGERRARAAVTAASAAPVVAAAKVAPVPPRGKRMSSAPVPKLEQKKMSPDERLFLAAGMGVLPDAKAAVKEEANVNAKHEEGNTPLHAAAVESKFDMMKYLLSVGANVNAKNNSGHTPLMIVALETGDAVAATALIDAGANVKEKDNNGRTALDIALARQAEVKKQWDDIVLLLQDEMAK